jgi:DnaJ-class molecular chaperone
MVNDYQKRKQERTSKFKETFGVKMVECPSCSGSGTYDSGGSPKCGTCNGKGKIRP